MILEHGVLDIGAGEEAAFEAALRQALPLITQAQGFGSIRISRCLERPNRYLLLVEWETLSHHTEGFRQSPAYEEWRRLLHHFFEPMPTIEHFRPVAAAPA